MLFEVGIDSQSLVMGFKMTLWTMHVEMGVSESVGSDVLNLMKDVPNFVNEFRNGDRPPIALLWVYK